MSISSLWSQRTHSIPLFIILVTFFNLSVTTSANVDLTQCPNLEILSTFDPIGTGPSPNVTLSIENNQLKVDVNTTYFGPQNAVWVVDFAPWDQATRSLSEPTNCENRLAASYSSKNFSDFWTAANSSLDSNALGSTDNLAYGPSGLWSQRSNGCGGVRFTFQETFATLLSCKSAANASSITYAYDAGTKKITYTGSVYVTLVRPVDSQTASSGYTRVQHQFPFSIELDASTHVVSSITSQDNLNLIISSVSTNSTGHLQIDLTSQLANELNGQYLTNPTVYSGPSGHDLYFVSNTIANTTVQSWVLRSATVQASYKGQYYLRWNITSGGFVESTIFIDIEYTAVQTIPLSLVPTASLFSDASFSTSATTFKTGDTIAVKMAMAPSAGDENNWALTLKNVWLCATSGTVPSYNPPSSYGCSVATSAIPSANIKQLVNEGSTAGAPTDMTPTIVTSGGTGITSNNQVGFYFSSLALTSQSAVFYVHVETLITQNTPAAVVQPNSPITLRVQQPKTAVVSTGRSLLAINDAFKNGRRDNLLSLILLPSVIPPAGPTNSSSGNVGGALSGTTTTTSNTNADLELVLIIASVFGGLSILGGVALVTQQHRKKMQQQEGATKSKAKAYAVQNLFDEELEMEPGVAQPMDVQDAQDPQVISPPDELNIVIDSVSEPMEFIDDPEVLNSHRSNQSNKSSKSNLSQTRSQSRGLQSATELLTEEPPTLNVVVEETETEIHQEIIKEE